MMLCAKCNKKIFQDQGVHDDLKHSELPKKVYARDLRHLQQLVKDNAPYRSENHARFECQFNEICYNAHSLQLFKRIWL